MSNSFCCGFWLRPWFVLCILAGLWGGEVKAALWEEANVDVLQLFPAATRVRLPDQDPAITAVYQLDNLLGFVFESDDLVTFPGFSGESINLRIGLDSEGTIKGIVLLRHHEPIFLHGLGETPMREFIAQYLDLSIKNRMLVGNRQGKQKDDHTLYLDGVTKATVSVMVIHDTILTAARKVAQAKLDGFGTPATTVLDNTLFRPMTVAELDAEGYLFRWLRTMKKPAAEADEAYIDMTFALLNPPIIGKNLLGEAEYDRLMESLRPGDIALLAESRGHYALVADDFIAGTTPWRLGLVQQGTVLALRDMDFYRLAQPVFPSGVGPFKQVRIFTFNTGSGFNPSEPLDFRINVLFANNPLESKSWSMSSRQHIPASLLKTVLQSGQERVLPLWQRIWLQREGELWLLTAWLVLLSGLFIFQHRLAGYGRYLAPLRLVSLVFIVGFIGIYAQGQLSVVNIYTLLLSLWNGFELGVFLLDPVLFLLWSYVFTSLFLWGRGLYCGWLCPFGAMQEMVAMAGRKLGIRPWRIGENWHRRLLLFKYWILAVLLGAGFYSLSLAETLAELEPFKTAVTLVFDRSWPFVLYAVLLLALSAKIHKAYCRYLCPLGAGLSVIGRLRIFSWLQRRQECGDPCRLCEKRCDIAAIKPDGEIDYNECIQCLECLSIRHDPQRCVVDRYGNKRKGKRAGNRQPEIPVEVVRARCVGAGEMSNPATGSEPE